MFVENYRSEGSQSIIGGGEANPIPYAPISAEDWSVWSTFVPVLSLSIDKVRARDINDRFLYVTQGIPLSVTSEIRRAADYFDEIEVWRKRELSKDPIAVGRLAGERYLIARWGMERLIPFETIKSRMSLVLAWKYVVSPLMVMVVFVALVYCAFILVWLR